MSVNPVSGNSDPQIDENKKAQYQAQYEEYYNTYTALINDDKYKSYFSENGDLKALKDALDQALQNLKNALDGVYTEETEEIIDALMQALGALLAQNALMGLEARIIAYIALFGLRNEGKITNEDYTALLDRLNSIEENLTEKDYNVLVNTAILSCLNGKGLITNEDYTALLSKLNSTEGLSGEIFGKLLEIAQYRKSASDFLEKNKAELGTDRCAALQEKLNINMSTLAEYSLEALKNYSTDFLEAISTLRGVLMSAMISANKMQRITQAGVLAMRVIQANNAFRDIESQLKAEESLENRANTDENLKRLRDEGIWADTTSKRREEVLQEEALQKARDAEQKTKNKNI